MKIVTAAVLYLGIIIGIFQNWLWFTGFIVLIFSLQFGALALIPVAILIDGYFGNFYGLPYLSILAIGWYLGIEYLRQKVLDPSLIKKSLWQN